MCSRSKTYLGSSRGMMPEVTATQLPQFTLSNDAAVNPLFHRMNKLFVHYCDGNSFLGNATANVAGAELVF